MLIMKDRHKGERQSHSQQKENIIKFLTKREKCVRNLIKNSKYSYEMKISELITEFIIISTENHNHPWKLRDASLCN